jgi:hypothetical protein
MGYSGVRIGLATDCDPIVPVTVSAKHPPWLELRSRHQNVVSLASQGHGYPWWAMTMSRMGEPRTVRKK